MFGFAGGLSQSDWLNLATGIIGTTTAAGTYNQTAYLTNAAMRQAQKYQDVSYRLSWVNVARFDIRSMLDTSVSRMNNYMVVGTLILGVAAGSLSVTFSEDAPDFLVYTFWVETGLAIFYFALCVMYAVAAQNSAFINTVRLLTWELQPERPAKYDFDYRLQALQMERRGGFSEMFRVPGWQPRQPDNPADCKAGYASSGGSSFMKPRGRPGDEEDAAELEGLEPPTRDLLYLKRYALFMRLWQPLDHQAKYSIALGLMSLSQSTASYSLATLQSSHRPLSGSIAVVMVCVFSFISLMVIGQYMQLRLTYVLVYTLFLTGPVSSTVASLVQEPRWVHALFACLVPVSNIVMCAVGILGSGSDGETATDTSMYITGPEGQVFSDDHFHLDRSTGAGGGLEAGDCSPMPIVMAPSPLEEAEIRRVRRESLQLFVAALTVALAAWVAVFISLVLTYTLHEVPVI